MKYGFIVPVYNHGSALKGVVEKLSAYNLPVIIIDDGNDAENKKHIETIVKSYNDIHLVVHDKNRGKGASIKNGIRKAAEIGLSHVLQIDSDGQHDTARIAYFLEQSEKHPDSVICGYPEYDEKAPASRVNGRKFANGWIHIVTLSNDIKDSMIGFRVYPVEPVMNLLQKKRKLPDRMGFDIAILVHLHWSGIPVRSESVKVFYPADGISNFNYIRDNLGISGTYTILFFGMLLRLPKLLMRKI